MRPATHTDAIKEVLRGMSEEQRWRSLLYLCLRLGEAGWRHRHHGGVNWKDALRRRGR